MSIDSKIESARDIVNRALAAKARPVIMFSGGKDSVVMTHLLRYVFHMGCELIFHREPFHTHKYAFGADVILKWGMTAYDYPPSGSSLWHGKGIVAFTSFYQIGNMEDGRPATLALPKNIIEPPYNAPSHEYLCGLVDIIRRPLGTFAYPWDVAFIGHKSSDEDQIAGKVPLHTDIVDNAAGPRLAFPLRDWTDEDVWEYTESRNLPVQHNRYVDRKEIPEKRYNSDYFNVCIRCIDRRNTDAEVLCPKLNKLVPRVEVPYQDISLPYFGEKTPCLQD